MAALTQSELREKLSGPLEAVLAKHGAELSRMAGNAGGLTASALQNDVLVRKIAEHCHEALPWPVRMAVRKPAFVEFVMANRGLVAAKLSAAAS